MEIPERLKKAEERTNPSPTEAQKIAGNYSKGKITIKGLRISIETPKGAIRSGKDQHGNEWRIEAKHPYGYFLGTVGKDGDPIDVYIGEDFTTDIVYVIDQIDPTTRAFDEHKVMLGFSSQDDAIIAYMSNFERGWNGFGTITPLSIKALKGWLFDGRLTQKPMSKIKSRINIVNEQEPRIEHILLKGEVIEGKTLSDLQSQIKGDFEALILEIRSPGGSVLEGMLILEWLEKLSQEGKYIVTLVSANAYSIASLIALCGHERLISRHGEIMVHNPMIPKIEYANANELENQALSLRRLEMILRELYCIFTGLDEATIEQLMSKESYIKPDKAIELNFADQIAEMQKVKYEMVSNVTHKIKNMSKTLNILNKVIHMIGGGDVVNQLYGTLEGKEIEIYQKDPSTYGVGDRTNVEEGEFKLADGATIEIEDYEIKKISNEVEQPATAEDLIPGTEVPAEDPAKVPATDPAPADEPAATDPMKEKEMLDEPKVEEPVAEVPAAPAPAPVAPLTPSQPAPTSPSEETMGMIEEMKKTIDALQKKVSDLTAEKLKDQIESMSAKMEKIEMKLTSFEKFEEIATEAIDTIATHTSSNFKPQARAQAPTEAKGSIFQQMKAKRGL